MTSQITWSSLGPGSVVGEKGEKNRRAKRAEGEAGERQ